MFVTYYNPLNSILSLHSKILTKQKSKKRKKNNYFSLDDTKMEIIFKKTIYFCTHMVTVKAGRSNVVASRDNYACYIYLLDNIIS